MKHINTTIKRPIINLHQGMRKSDPGTVDGSIAGALEDCEEWREVGVQGDFIQFCLQLFG